MALENGIERLIEHKNNQCVPVFVVVPDGRRNFRVREDWQLPVWFRNQGGALDILVSAEANIDRGVAHSLQ